jgi:hypothetical protein
VSEYVYHIDEGALELPAEFIDASVNVFEWIGKSGRMNVTIQRQRCEHNQTFEQLVHEATSSYPKLFTNYAEEEPMDIAMDVPVLSKRFRWRQDTGVSYHHQVFLNLNTVVMTITATGSAAGREEVDASLDRVLRSLQFREKD